MVIQEHLIICTMGHRDLDEISGSKGLKIIHVNTRSVFSKLDELKVKLNHFDIIIFTETWLNCDTDDSLLHWEGYNLVRQDRGLTRNKRGGGVCIYIREEISYRINQDYKNLIGSNLEFILLNVKPHMQKPINLIGIYRPPDGNPKECVSHLTFILNQIDRTRSDTVLIGDFNLNYKNKRLISSTKIETLVNKFSLKQWIKENTRITSSSTSCIDLIFTDILNIIDQGVIDYNISAHLPIHMIKKKARNHIKKMDAFGRSYLHYNDEVFSRLLHETDWEVFAAKDDPESLWDIFIDNIMKVLDQICPVRKVTVVTDKPDWLTNELLVLIRQRDKAYRKARHTKQPNDWDIARQLRNRVKMDIRTSKANVIRDKLATYQYNPKKFWQELNKLLPGSHSAVISEITDDSTGKRIPEDSLNNHINEYFATIGSKLADECTPGIVADPLIPIMNPTMFNRVPFTEIEVLKVCTDIDIWKSSSIPNVKTHVLKHAFISNIDRITKIFNASLIRAIFPQSWKLSTVVPLPKVSHPKTASDLRPVALTPLPGKLLEKLICSRLQTWIMNNNILSDCQHGFRKKKSTISAIAQLLNDIYTHINRRVNPYIIFLDLKKAFDTISHVKLLTKLETMGMDVATLSWFSSYLTGRQQCVKLNDETSNTLSISYGVPQGSILGPILFSIYINDIANLVDCGIVLYADDTVLYHHDRKLQHGVTIIC